MIWISDLSSRLRTRLALLAVVLVVAIGGAGAAVFFVISGAGQSSIEAWIGGQIKSAVDAQLVPTLDFDTLDYQAPYTLVLEGASLTSDDPDRPGERVVILEAQSLRIRLAELPKRGEPLQLASIRVRGAVARLIQTESGQLIGYSNLSDAPVRSREEALSELLEIGELDIQDTTVIYDTRRYDIEPMQLDNIDTVVRINRDASGLYQLKFDTALEDIFACRLSAGLDLDSMAAEIGELDFDLLLGPDQMRYLPPAVQEIVNRHSLTGKLSAKATGKVSLEDPMQDLDASVQFTLTDAHGSIGEVRLPIQYLKVDAQVTPTQVLANRIDANLLGGRIDGSARLSMNATASPSVEANLSGEGLLLESLFAIETGPTPGGGEPSSSAPVEPTLGGSKPKGKVDFQVLVSAPLDQVLKRARGRGEVRLTEGRIAGLPIVSPLIKFMESSGDVAQLSGEAPGTDTALATFELRGDHAYLSKTEVEASWYAMRGRGKVFFDRRVAMKVNAGPLEKMQNALGAVGRVIGAVTDGLLAYRVRGEIGALRIQPIPLGGIVAAPGDDESAEDFLGPEDAEPAQDLEDASPPSDGVEELIEVKPAD